MIIHRELIASWHQPSETILICRTEPTSLHLLAAQYTEKIINLVEANERLLDTKRGFVIRDFDCTSRSNNWKVSCESQYVQKGVTCVNTKQHNHQGSHYGISHKRFHHVNHQVGRGRGNGKATDTRRHTNSSSLSSISPEIITYPRCNRSS